ncbi:unnamed protein product, partial [Effrenium voratum]
MHVHQLVRDLRAASVAGGATSELSLGLQNQRQRHCHGGDCDTVPHPEGHGEGGHLRRGQSHRADQGRGGQRAALHAAWHDSGRELRGQGEMVGEILESVKGAMGKYGYEILNVLITDVRPERSVMDAMNEINASRRQREAAFERGEAEKMLKIKASEGDAEAKRLAGVGMANMRAAMAQGFQDSMRFMKESGMSEHEAMHMMIMTQYLDTLKEFAGSHGSIIVPHGPSAVKDLESQIREGFLSASPQQQRP